MVRRDVERCSLWQRRASATPTTTPTTTRTIELTHWGSGAENLIAQLRAATAGAFLYSKSWGLRIRDRFKTPLFHTDPVCTGLQVGARFPSWICPDYT